MKKIIIFLVLLVEFASVGYSQSDGILISDSSYQKTNRNPEIIRRRTVESPIEQEISTEVEAMIGEYVQQIVINTVLSKVGEIMQRTINAQSLQVMPQVGQNAVQQAALQIFKQEEMGNMTRDAYDQSREYAIYEQKQGSSQASIQSGIKNRVDEVLASINEDSTFRRIVEHYLKESVSQTKKMVMMNVAQRQAQILAIQQQQAAMQVALQQQYLQAVQLQMEQQAIQQQYIQQLQQGVY